MSYHPDDRPDPSEQPLRARVPEHVAAGCFSTGVIVMTAQTEFILDFVQNLGRPHQIVARVVLPHGVLPQLVDALGRNMQLYRSRFGELPQPFLPGTVQIQSQLPPFGAPSEAGPFKPQANLRPAGGDPSLADPAMPSSGDAGYPGSAAALGPGATGPGAAGAVPTGVGPTGQAAAGQPPAHTQGNAGASAPQAVEPPRQASAQEIYDDLKIRDELLSGAYANAVMIGHGPHEFSFDFMTNFYPHSSVSTRVFLAAGQIPRLHESLKSTWEQLRSRVQPPPPPPPPKPTMPPNNPPPPGWLS